MDATHAKLLVGAPTLSTHTAVALAAVVVHATMAANPGTTVAPEPLAAVAMATSSEHSATTMASQALTLSIHTAVALATEHVHATMAANPGTTVAPKPPAAVAMATSSDLGAVHMAVALAADLVHATMAANPGTTVAPEPLAAVAMATSSEHSATTMASQALLGLMNTAVALATEHVHATMALHPGTTVAPEPLAAVAMATSGDHGTTTMTTHTATTAAAATEAPQTEVCATTVVPVANAPDTMVVPHHGASAIGIATHVVVVRADHVVPMTTRHATTEDLAEVATDGSGALAMHLDDVHVASTVSTVDLAGSPVVAGDDGFANTCLLEEHSQLLGFLLGAGLGLGLDIRIETHKSIQLFAKNYILGGETHGLEELGSAGRHLDRLVHRDDVGGEDKSASEGQKKKGLHYGFS